MNLQFKFCAIVFFALVQRSLSMMKAMKDDHSKCGCPAVWQRQPRQLRSHDPDNGAPGRSTGRIFNALMKLARPAPLSKVVRTICLPAEDEEPRAGLECVTSGWGRSGPSPSLSSALLEANVPLLELAECLKAYGKSVPIRDGHLCAGNTDGSSGSCVGDSGGPLQCRRPDGVWQLVGVTSFGSGCARPGFPDVYTKIQYYSPWIRDTIANDVNR